MLGGWLTAYMTVYSQINQTQKHARVYDLLFLMVWATLKVDQYL